ncbi:hypothetical protein PYW07_009788 [Mythimna separata]|uniref:Nucleic-acid-binding protein from transposon X-element n=1 Tax=Mythimna separata TaxID=271217 RepID=A0AAD8DNN8_MYTSE|nr:hypothetical protein PYW07_009788 [Mythimna separata]
MERFITRSNSVGKRPLEGPVDTSEWKIPKFTLPAAEQNKPVPVKTSNQFSVLRSVKPQETDVFAARLKAATTPKRKSGHIPPIILQMKPEWTHNTIKNLVLKHTKNFDLQYRSNNKIVISCYSPESHQAVKEGFQANDLAFHTFPRKDEKSYKAVIFGLPAYTEDSLAEELEILGFKDAKLRRMKLPADNNKGNDFCPPILVQLPAGSDFSKFLKIRYISNCVVQIQKYQAKNPFGTQCFRCQGFGHSSRNCNLSPRCVKCIESHPTSECPKKDRTRPAQCCNCKGDHPANFRQCIERQKYLKLIQARQDQIKATRDAKISPKIRNVDGRSWNTVVAANKTESSTTEAQSQIGTEDQTTADMLAILMTIKSIKSQFVTCNSMMDKVILILTHLGKYV